jgi:rhamnosyltransferase
MEDKECDFWGMSEFPELQNSLRPEAEALPDRTIPAHLQSYFLVLRKSVLQSAEFAEYWKNFKNHSSLLDVVANGELTFTQYFKQAGFRAASYFPLAAWLQMRRAGDIYYNAIYNDAQDFLFLGFPMMKKNIYYCLYQPELLMLQNYIAAMTDYPAEILNFVSKKY